MHCMSIFFSGYSWLILCRFTLAEGRNDTTAISAIAPLSGLGQFQSVCHLDEHLWCIVAAFFVQLFYLWRIWKLITMQRIIYFTMMGLITIVRPHSARAIETVLHDFRLPLDLLLGLCGPVYWFVSDNLESKRSATKLWLVKPHSW